MKAKIAPFQQRRGEAIDRAAARLHRDNAPHRHCESEATTQSILFVLLWICFAEPVIGRAFARPVGSQ